MLIQIYQPTPNNDGRPDPTPWLINTDQIESVVAIDANTVRIRLINGEKIDALADLHRIEMLERHAHQRANS